MISSDLNQATYTKTRIKNSVDEKTMTTRTEFSIYITVSLDYWFARSLAHQINENDDQWRKAKCLKWTFERWQTYCATKCASKENFTLILPWQNKANETKRKGMLHMLITETKQNHQVVNKWSCKHDKNEKEWRKRSQEKRKEMKNYATVLSSFSATNRNRKNGKA